MNAGSICPACLAWLLPYVESDGGTYVDPEGRVWQVYVFTTACKECTFTRWIAPRRLVAA